VPDSRDEDALVDALVRCVHEDEPVVLLVGSGVTAPHVPPVGAILELADRYAGGRGDDGDLSAALAQARRELGPAAARIEVYLAYRRVFADWVSGGEFDVVAQQAVLQAYRPKEWGSSPLAAHGIWQRVDLALGEQAENDAWAWALPPGVEALGRLLARHPDAFGNRVLTTNFDPLVEIAIRRAGESAISVPVATDGSSAGSDGADAGVRVFHLHGFWRPAREPEASPLLHDPDHLAEPAEGMVKRIAGLVNGDVVGVVGCGGWDRVVTAALRACGATRPLRVLWALRGSSERVPGDLAAALGRGARWYGGVDSDRLFTRLARALDVPEVHHDASRWRARHLGWERELMSQPPGGPPRNADGLMRVLERRFGWGRDDPDHPETPALLFWPVRVRPRASLIHAVQALVAGALVARGVRPAVVLDDFGVPQRRTTNARFSRHLLSWMRLTAADLPEEFPSLQDFIDDPQRGRQEPGPRPTDPWTIARILYGEHNPSLYSVLTAVKVLPNVPLRDLDEQAPLIAQALLSKDANRLLTPLTLWPYLHHLLHATRSGGVLTLGGRDEGAFWALWRGLFGLGLRHLFNPHLRSLSNESGMVRWSTRRELREHLGRARAGSDWDQPGRYIPWLFQNAVLLPGFLRGIAPPEVDGHLLDSWASFVAALGDGLPALDVLADLASDFYLGTACG